MVAWPVTQRRAVLLAVQHCAMVRRALNRSYVLGHMSLSAAPVTLPTMGNATEIGADARQTQPRGHIAQRRRQRQRRSANRGAATTVRRGLKNAHGQIAMVAWPV